MLCFKIIKVKTNKLLEEMFRKRLLTAVIDTFPNLFVISLKILYELLLKNIINQLLIESSYSLLKVESCSSVFSK